MDDRRVTEVLTAHAAELTGQPGAMQEARVTDEEREELTPYLELATGLEQSMQPVHPSAAFVRSLGKELASGAKHQIAYARRMRRGVLIGAAAVGSLVSIASVVGAIVYMISRLRARAHARAAHAPMS